jgi:hypothetical protein
MRVTLHDFEHGTNGQFDGAHVESTLRLCEILGQLQHLDPFVLQLEGENGFNLTVGIGGPVAFIQHSSNDGNPPYLVAVTRDAREHPNNGEHIFFCGGQDTPIRSSQCVPFECLQSTACHFLETGSRSKEVDWIEI